MTLPSPFKTHSESGVGLISMMLVILSIALAAATVVAMISPSLMTRRNQETEEKLSLLKSAITKYSEDHAGGYPVALELLRDDEGIPCEIDNDPASDTYLMLQGGCGPYVDQVYVEYPDQFQTDGWGTKFNYVPATGKATSCGPDLTCGNGDDLE